MLRKSAHSFSTLAMTKVLFDGYESDFREAIQKINASGGSFSSALAEASECLRSMEFAVRDAAPEDAERLCSHYAACKSMFASVKKSVLIADCGASSKFEEERARSRARINSIASLHQLQKSVRVASETESVAASVLGTLGEQRAVLESSRATLGYVDSQLKQSDRKIRQMSSWWAWCTGM